MRQLVVAVTGARGYIGSELCSELINRGHHVIQIDKEINNGYVETILPDFKPSLEYADCIVHLAAESGIANCQKDPQKAIKSNMIATSMLMDYATNYGEHAVPLIFASSSAADKPLSSLYANTKFFGEQYAKHMNENYDGQNYVLRFSNVYGGSEYLEKKTSVVAKLLNAIIKDETFVINGDGSQTRDFIHVSRIVDAIIKLIELIQTKDEVLVKNDALLKPIDICTGTQLSINDLVQNIIKIIDTNIKLEFDKSSSSVGVTTGKSDYVRAAAIGLVPKGSSWGLNLQKWPAEDLTNYIREILA